MKPLYCSLRYICISFFIALLSGPAAAATNYSVTLLKDNASAARSGSNAIDIDPTGLVVGQSFSSDFDNHAFVWFDTNSPTDLTPSIGYTESAARGINSNQEVVVSLTNGTSFVWSNGAQTDIVSLTGASVLAFDINDASQVVGSLGGSPTVGGNERAFIWENGVMTDLGTLPGGGGSAAYAINNFGQVVGSAYDASGDEHAVIWNAGVITDLGILPGDVGSRASGINDAGVVVGVSFTTKQITSGSTVYTITDVMRAFTWSNGALTELDGAGSRANDINNSGQIVGSKKIADVWHAMVWNNGVSTDLNPLLNSLDCFGNAVNDNGQIIGKCIDLNRTSLSFRLNPSSTSSNVDLAVTINAAPSPVTEDTNLTYSITVTNAGSSTATGVTMTDALPGVIFRSASSSQGSCSGTNTVVCALGNLAAGNTASVTIVVTPHTAGILTNGAGALSNEADTNLANNSASTSVVVESASTPPPPPPPANDEADLEVNISADSSKVKRGEELEYTVKIKNNGPDTAEDVVLTDKLPSNVNFVSVNGTGCSGSINITCQLGDLNSGASKTVFITVSPFKGRRVTNTVSVTSSTSDPDSGNNTDKEKTRVRR